MKTSKVKKVTTTSTTDTIQCDNGNTIIIDSGCEYSMSGNTITVYGEVLDFSKVGCVKTVHDEIKLTTYGSLTYDEFKVAISGKTLTIKKTAEKKSTYFRIYSMFFFYFTIIVF